MIPDIELAIIDKVREKANESEVMNVIGSVEGKTVIIVDDLVDTSGTLCKGADALREKGAEDIYAFVPVMSDKQVEKKSDEDTSKYQGLSTVVEKLNMSPIKTTLCFGYDSSSQ